MIDFRLTARRDATADKAFLSKAIERVRLHRPVTITTDKAQTCRRVIRDINCRYEPHFDSIRHIDKKWRINLIESDHAATKLVLGYRQSFRFLRSAKATLSGVETRRTIKRVHIHHNKQGARERSRSSTHCPPPPRVARIKHCYPCDRRQLTQQSPLSCRDGLLSDAPYLRGDHVLMLSKMSRVSGMRSRELPIRSRQRGPTSSAVP